MSVALTRERVTRLIERLESPIHIAAWGMVLQRLTAALEYAAPVPDPIIVPVLEARDILAEIDDLLPIEDGPYRRCLIAAHQAADRAQQYLEAP